MKFLMVAIFAFLASAHGNSQISPFGYNNCNCNNGPDSALNLGYGYASGYGSNNLYANPCWCPYGYGFNNVYSGPNNDINNANVPPPNKPFVPNNEYVEKTKIKVQRTLIRVLSIKYGSKQKIMSFGKLLPLRCDLLNTDPGKCESGNSGVIYSTLPRTAGEYSKIDFATQGYYNNPGNLNQGYSDFGSTKPDILLRSNPSDSLPADSTYKYLG